MFKWLDFKITNRCNNNCTYCGEKQDPPSANNILSPETIQNTLDEALKLNFSHFALLGGEPSIRDDFDIILKPLQNGRRFETMMVITNLLEFNEQMYNEVFKTNANIAQVVTSIDNLKYPNYKHQDPEKTLNYVQKIKEIASNYSHLGKREIHIHSVISRENLNTLSDHVKYFNRDDVDVSLALVEPFVIIDENTKKSELKYNEFTKMDINNIIRQLNELEKEKKLNWANNVLRTYILHYMGGELGNYFGCTAGKNHVIIESNGYVYPCLTESYRRGLNFGNIINEKFSQIYKKMDSFQCKSDFKQTCWDHYLWTELDHFSLPNVEINKFDENKKKNLDIFKLENLDIIDPIDKPEKLVVELSAKCNLNCIMCGFNKKAGFNGDFITKEILDSFLNNSDFFSELKEIRLNGRGESSICPNFEELIKIFRNNYPKTRLTLFTNLMFNNNNFLNAFVENWIELYISIDASTKNLFESIRKGANFNVLIERLNILKDYKNKFAVFTIQPKNIEEIYNIGELAHSYNMGLILNVFRSDKHLMESEFKKKVKENWEFIIQSIAKLRENYPDMKIMIPDQICGFMIPNELSNTKSSGTLEVCPNAIGEIMIAYNGDVFPCNMFHPVKLGNIKEMAIHRIWNGFDNRQFIKNYKNHPYCNNCEYLILKEGK